MADSTLDVTQPLHTAKTNLLLIDNGDSTYSIAAGVTAGSSAIGGVSLVDESGVLYGVKHISNKPRVSSMPYLYDIAEGNVTGHSVWSNIGFTPTMTTTESDVWSKAGAYVFPTAAQQMEAVSGDNTEDIGTVIFSGTSTGGSATTLIDTAKDFTAGTAVAVGDCVILEKSGTTPEWGYVTAVAETTLTIGGGFSSGGTGSLRAYSVVDYSAYPGAHAIYISYLNGSYVEDTEIVILNGTTAIDTVQTDLFRIQEARVIAAGSNNKPTGAISVRNTAGTVTYGYITAKYTHSRSSIFTVPAGKTIYIVSMSMAYGFSTNQTHYARLSLRSNYIEDPGFRTGNIFYPSAETVLANTSFEINFGTPLALLEKVDIKVVGISTFSGIASVVMRGWIE